MCPLGHTVAYRHTPAALSSSANLIIFNTITSGARPAFCISARLIQEGEMGSKSRKLTVVQVLAMALLTLATPAFAQVAQLSPMPRAKRTVVVSVLDRQLTG